MPKQRTPLQAEPVRTVPELIARKRDGGELSEIEIRALIDGFVRGTVADYQMSALAMAIVLRGMSPKETTALTLAMRDSGTLVDTSSIRARKIDKHSTGGVGDKISICLAPLVAACGVAVPMVSGRGLGHTGGTLDKLEAIAGFTTALSVAQMLEQLRGIGCALAGQTEDIAPADKRLYALRDVTGTVESVPLITASILSKKLAEGIDGLVLDVKVGRGAFMKTLEDARELARSLVRVGRLAGKQVIAVLTSMDAPLGRAIGNALETREAFEILHDRGPEDVRELTLVLGAEMLRMAGAKAAEARKQLEAALKNGAGAAKMREIVRAQGGDPRVVDEPDRLPQAKVVVDVHAPEEGFVTAIDALELGLLGVALGAGRTRADQAVDPSVGIMVRAPVGVRVKKGEAIAELHLASLEGADAHAARAAEAWTFGGRRPKAQPLVLGVMRR